ncbi:MAG: tetratricopeptide repeat protein [Bacteroidetes bacterium]|nr:MAG: tetratricopeptide repeat protein [Bacteroidota bacterium]
MKTLSLLFFLLPLMLAGQMDTAQVSAYARSYQFEQYEEYQKAIDAIKPYYSANDYAANLRLGWLTYMTGDYSRSINYYQQAMKLAPGAIEPRMGYVYPAAALENWEDVIAQYEAVLKISPQHTVANYRLASIYYARKEYKKAETYARKVVTLYPFDHDSVLLLAWINVSLGNLQEAKEGFFRALLFNPSDTSALEGLKLVK